MIAQLFFYAAAAGLWLYFRHTSGQERRHALLIAFWIVIAIQTFGFVTEMAMRGGGIPITN